MNSVGLDKIIKNFNLEIICLATNYKNIKLYSSTLNKPGLQLNGFYENFYASNLQVIGKEEWSFINKLNSKEKCKIFETLFSKNIPAIIFFGDNYIDDIIIDKAKKYNISILRTKSKFSKFYMKLDDFFDIELAPSTRVHGVLMDVYGVGVLITGESGIGKSECALELISKGSRLISDDITIIKNINNMLIGNSPEVTKYLMEIRGLGILNIRRLFGIGSVLERKEIEMVANLEIWDSEKEYDRLGHSNLYENILDKKIEKYIIPVKPGRNNALIIEIAAKIFKQNEMKINQIEELNNKIFKKQNKLINNLRNMEENQT